MSAPSSARKMANVKDGGEPLRRQDLMNVLSSTPSRTQAVANGRGEYGSHVGQLSNRSTPRTQEDPWLGSGAASKAAEMSAS
eukprot:CAMPEP_0184300654 /NCGR_PEP_ID=MMETSP1049-20130417/11036_1 /TAXON_ID=77928 /ORGANISM="Proteomonas sulcata, Strain CCMP704" /LENGTH=81 /DNA_ID=CAMNT_0026611443 /DNA_START=251 /DNA_END=492 /DNA_ORIENTATION=-